MSLQLWLKEHFLKSQKEFILGTYQRMHVIEFSTDPVTQLRSDSTTNAVPAILEILRALTRNICGVVSFYYRYSW